MIGSGSYASAYHVGPSGVADLSVDIAVTADLVIFCGAGRDIPIVAVAAFQRISLLIITVVKRMVDLIAVYLKAL